MTGEPVGEMGLVLEAGKRGDLTDLQVGVQQKMPGFLEALRLKVLVGRHPAFGLKNTIEVAYGEPGMEADFLEVEFGRVEVVIDVLGGDADEITWFGRRFRDEIGIGQGAVAGSAGGGVVRILDGTRHEKENDREVVMGDSAGMARIALQFAEELLASHAGIGLIKEDVGAAGEFVFIDGETEATDAIALQEDQNTAGIGDLSLRIAPVGEGGAGGNEESLLTLNGDGPTAAGLAGRGTDEVIHPALQNAADNGDFDGVDALLDPVAGGLETDDEGNFLEFKGGFGGDGNGERAAGRGAEPDERGTAFGEGDEGGLEDGFELADFGGRGGRHFFGVGGIWFWK